MGGTVTIGVIVAVAIFAAIAAFWLFIWLRRRRNQRRNISTKLESSQSLKDRWRSWTSNFKRSRGGYSSRLHSSSDSASLHPVTTGGRGNSRSSIPALEQMRRDDSGAQTPQSTVERNRDLEAGRTRGTPASNQDAVNRHTSVRSVMTLPMYSVDPAASEQILGREGERGGIDVVLEFPETSDDVEERREAEMASLYRIRLARRAEAAEREERRRLRREARNRGDWAEVERLRIEAREAQQQRDRELEADRPGAGTSAARLIAQHQEDQARRERHRRVSSVQYAELGVARHDGSRVRAGSNASARSEDNRPLLNGAAGMGQTSGTSNGSSERHGGGAMSTLGDTLSVHNRNRSTTSVMSVDTFGTDEEEGMYQPPFAPTSRGRSTTVTTTGSSPDFEVVSLHSEAAEASSNTPRASQSRSHSRTASTSRLARVQTNNSTASSSSQSINTQQQDSSQATEQLAHITQSSTNSSHPHLLQTPIEAPPHYEHLAETTFGEPPTYQSPTSPNAPEQTLPPSGLGLAGIERLPSIRISESVTPVEAAVPAGTEQRW